MTRIMLQLFLLLAGGGILLLTSGETAVSFIQDHTFPTHPSPVDTENASFHIIAESSAEVNIPRERPISENYAFNQTEPEPNEQDLKPTSSVNEGKDPTATDEMKDVDLTTISFSFDSRNTTLEDGVELSSESESKENSAEELSESTVITKVLDQNSQRITDSVTTNMPTSSTKKRSLILTTSQVVEETTSNPGQLQTSQGSKDESSSVPSESLSSSEESSSAEKFTNDSLNVMEIHHRVFMPENEATTQVSNKDRETEFEEMAGSEDHMEVVLPKVQSIVVSPSVVVTSQQHGVMNGIVKKDSLEENGVGSSDEQNQGVTFDPDGMTHDGPQDPDSVVFNVTENSGEIEVPNHDHETAHKKSEEVHLEKEINTNEREIIPNGGGKFEKLEHIDPEPERGEMGLSPENSSNSDTLETAVTLPEFQIHKDPTNDESEEMLQDAPHGIDNLPDFSAHTTPAEIILVTEKQRIETKPSISSTEKTISTEEPKLDIVHLSTEGNSGLVTHIPDQSILRPVNISSPSDLLPNISILPVTEPPAIMQSPSISTEGKVVEFSSSSPALPVDPVLNVVDKKVETSSPELVETFSATPNGTMIPILTRVDVKSSVSLNVLSTESTAGNHSTDTANSSVISVHSPIFEVKSNETSLPSPTDASTPSTTTTEPSTTISKIRKPKLKIGDDETRPSRAPYVPKRPNWGTTEASAPVSIFKKQRTRIASITSSTTARPYSYRPYSTIRVHYATHHNGMPILPELIISTEPIQTTTEPPPTTTEDPVDEVPFTDTTEFPVVSDEEETTLVKVAGYVALDRGIRWDKLLDNRQTAEYKEAEANVLLHLERMFRSSPIADRLWKIEIDGFSGSRNSRPVGVDFFLYLIKSIPPVAPEQLESIFREKLTSNRTFGTFRADIAKTTFEVLQEEPLVKATPPPDDGEDEAEPPIPQWAIACIVIGAASLIFIVLFAAVTLYGRHHMRRRYSASKLGDGEGEGRSSGDWESKMAAAYENMAADTIYDAEDNTYKKSYILD